MIGNCMAAGFINKARKYTLIGFLIAFELVILLFAVLILLRDEVSKIFTDNGDV